ncbi:MAG: hypothetical protein M3Q19_15180 [Pseudomonadota bacterium]|nr:hypothetical protein [Pseudomonadota bacterium]
MLAVLFSVMLVASETTTAPQTNNQSPVTNEAAEREKKICKRQPVTGQIQGTKRVCMTAEQWKRVQEADQRRR